MRIRDVMAKRGGLGGQDTLNIVSFALSMRKEETLTRLDMELGEDARQRVERLLDAREAGKPLAYITGEKEFFSRPFHVDGRVLIPRPETELLVELALDILKKEPWIRTVLDMGTGSGIIGNTIARISSRNVLCVDISQEALQVARENGRDAEVSERLTFLCSDLFSGIRENARFDMILANLPYVAENEWDEVMTDVRDFEPALALKGGPDGLDIYRKFVGELGGYLSGGGYVLAEIGATGQAEKMVDLLKSCGLSGIVKTDLAGRERMIIAHG